MIEDVDDSSRQAWARVAGLLYLLTNATAIFAFAVSGGFMVRNDPVQTAANIAASASWFRLAVASELVTIAGVIPLAVGLYVVLKPVSRNLALLALLWRIMENCVLAVITFSTFTALALIAGGGYISAADMPAAQAMAFSFLRVHAYGFQVGFLFLGLGSTLFSYLWLKSGYIPKAIAAWGIFASAVMAVVALGIIIWPPLYGVVTMAYMAPMGIYEIGLGLWLLIKGVRLPARA
jgi:Domain of unknown function (DUF4386)